MMESPALIALVAVLLLHIRYLRTGSFRYAAGAAATLGAGLLFSEKTLFVGPLLLALVLAFFSSGSLLGRLLQTLRHQWAAWLLYLAVSLPYLWYYVTSVPTS